MLNQYYNRCGYEFESIIIGNWRNLINKMHFNNFSFKYFIAVNNIDRVRYIMKFNSDYLQKFDILS